MKILEKADVSYIRYWISKTLALNAPGKHRLLTGNHGFTLVELLVVVAILGVLVILALPAYNDYKYMAKVSRCKSEIRSMENVIALYVIDKATLPSQLSDLPTPAFNDPWGHPYHYYNIATSMPVTESRYWDLGGVDPLSLDYDLFSTGMDGITSYTLSDPQSLNDIVRVNSGSNVDGGSIVELGSKRGE
jgi:prepilin-type N-terminal cleavage/methylation domain-containing protein